MHVAEGSGACVGGMGIGKCPSGGKPLDASPFTECNGAPIYRVAYHDDAYSSSATGSISSEMKRSKAMDIVLMHLSAFGLAKESAPCFPWQFWPPMSREFVEELLYERDD